MPTDCAYRANDENAENLRAILLLFIFCNTSSLNIVRLLAVMKGAFCSSRERFSQNSIKIEIIVVSAIGCCVRSYALLQKKLWYPFLDILKLYNIHGLPLLLVNGTMGTVIIASYILYTDGSLMIG